jgi:DNA-binding transcriptional regulator YdaS (Cro superfamily)
MDLAKYIKRKKVTRYQAAKEIGMSPQQLYTILNGTAKAGLKSVVKIERWSEGAVTRKDLRPEM